MRYLLCIISCLFLTKTLYSIDESPKCLIALEMNFFQEETVFKVLNLNRIGQSSWDIIMNQLSRNSSFVPNLMRQAAKNSHPNPLDHPFNPREAEKLLIPILYNIFKEALISIGFFNESGIRSMFDLIYESRKGELRVCLNSTSKPKETKKISR